MLNIPKAIAYILIATAIVSFTEPKQEDKNVTITLPVSEWQSIVQSVSSSKTISAYDAQQIITEIQEQANKQLATDTTKTPTQKSK